MWGRASISPSVCSSLAEGKVKVHYSTERLEDINGILGRMRDNKIDGRVVMKI